MSRLSDEQQTVIQRYVDKALIELESAGLRLTVESDLAKWVEFMKTAPQITAVSPTLDPEHSDVRPANSFWVALETFEGRVVACAAHRLFRCDDFLDLIRSYKVFYDRKPVLHFRPVNIVAPPEAPLLAGRVGYGGGHWIHPDYRGQGLASYLPRIHRALGLRHFDYDWYVALVREQINAGNAYGAKVGIPHKFVCIRGWFPPRHADGEYGIIYASRHEVLAELRQATEAASPLRIDRRDAVPAIAAE